MEEYQAWQTTAAAEVRKPFTWYFLPHHLHRAAFRVQNILSTSSSFSGDFAFPQPAWQQFSSCYTSFISSFLHLCSEHLSVMDITHAKGESPPEASRAAQCPLQASQPGETLGSPSSPWWSGSCHRLETAWICTVLLQKLPIRTLLQLAVVAATLMAGCSRGKGLEGSSEEQFQWGASGTPQCSENQAQGSAPWRAAGAAVLSSLMPCWS